MRLLLAGFVLVGLAACGEMHPNQSGGVSAVPTTAGGLGGPQEGSPGNATNLGSDTSTIYSK